MSTSFTNFDLHLNKSIHMVALHGSMSKGIYWNKFETQWWRTAATENPFEKCAGEGAFLRISLK